MMTTAEAPCLLWSVASDGTLADVNQLFCHHTGFNRHELIGKQQDIILTVATRIFQQTHFLPLIKLHGRAEEIYITIKTKDGKELPLLVNASRRQSEQGYAIDYAGIAVHNRKRFEDELVSARKAAENALRENLSLQQAKTSLQEYSEQLDQQLFTVARQNDEMRQFNRVVTHDLQEPLRKLFLFANVALETEDAATQKTTLKKVHKVSQQLRTIVSGLQQYVWLTDANVHYRTIELKDLFRQIRLEVEKEHGEVKINMKMDELPSIEADADQVHFLFREIVNNAVRFRKDDIVELRISCMTLSQNQFRKLKDKYKYADYLKIEIEDKGIGFDAEYNEQVFDLFRRLHDQSGRGLGLSLCKRIVEHHGGDISIHSQIGKGAMVDIWLPLTKEGAKPEDEETINLKREGYHV